MLRRVLEKFDGLIPRVHAHCDIPCGIYDPHIAQMAVHTILRMIILIKDQKIAPDATPEERQEFVQKMARFTHVKEEHAEICKREIRILWGDYFKPEHAQKFPELNDLVWKSLKLASKARQEVNLQVAEELLENVQKIAEVFWKSKNISCARVKAPYPTERTIVLPKL